MLEGPKGNGTSAGSTAGSYELKRMTDSRGEMSVRVWESRTREAACSGRVWVFREHGGQIQATLNNYMVAMNLRTTS